MKTRQDIAAMVAAAIAVPLTIIEQTRPYDAIDLIVGLTLLALVMAYGYSEKDPRFPERLAVACVTGLVIIPVVGWATDFVWPSVTANFDQVPRMNHEAAAVVWVVAVTTALIFDLRLRRPN